VSGRQCTIQKRQCGRECTIQAHQCTIQKHSCRRSLIIDLFESQTSPVTASVSLFSFIATASIRLFSTSVFALRGAKKKEGERKEKKQKNYR
jgi:hypothetical protein